MSGNWLWRDCESRCEGMCIVLVYVDETYFVRCIFTYLGNSLKRGRYNISVYTHWEDEGGATTCVLFVHVMEHTLLTIYSHLATWRTPSGEVGIIKSFVIVNNINIKYKLVSYLHTTACFQPDQMINNTVQVVCVWHREDLVYCKSTLTKLTFLFLILFKRRFIGLLYIKGYGISTSTKLKIPWNSGIYRTLINKYKRRQFKMKQIRLCTK